MIKVLFIAVGGNPEVREIPPTLKAMQELVGGYIEAIHLEPHVDLFCDEEGKLKGKHLNITTPYDGIVGDCFVSRHNDAGEPVSLTDEDIKKYMERFS